MINPKKTTRSVCSIRPMASSTRSHRFPPLEMISGGSLAGSGPGIILTELEAPLGFEPLDRVRGPEEVEGSS